MSEWDDFMEDVERRSHRRSSCSVGDLLDTLSPDAREAVEAALNRPELSGASIAAALSRRTGKSLAGQTLNRHRRKECSCSTGT